MTDLNAAVSSPRSSASTASAPPPGESGHPTSGLSAADLMAVLLAKYLRYDWADPHLPNNDRLIFSKGHACPLLYAMFKAAGAITDEELLTLRKFGSRLQGHPNPHVLPCVDVATGSLGQGLADRRRHGPERQVPRQAPLPRLGAARRQRDGRGLRSGRRSTRPAYYKLDNLIGDPGHEPARPARRDRPRLERRRLRRPRAGVRLARHRAGRPRPRRRSTRAYAEALATNGPADLPDRRDGEGPRRVVPSPNKERLARQGARRRAGEAGHRRAGRRAQPRRSRRSSPRPASRPPPPTGKPLKLPTYEVGSKEATRKAYGDALVGGRRGAGPTWSPWTARCPTRRTPRSSRRPTPSASSRCSSPSSRLVAAAVGLAVLGKGPFASTFAAFFTRAYDQIRMAAISQRHDPSGAARTPASRIGEDGPSQMALEDLAMMRAVYGSTVLYPCDANQTAQLVDAMVDLPGHRLPAHDAREDAGALRARRGVPGRRQQGGAAVGRRPGHGRRARASRCTRRSRRTTRSQAEGIAVRVIDAYSVKPIDAATLRAGRRGHRRQAGRGRGPLARGRARRRRAGRVRGRRATALRRSSSWRVRGMPGSGTPAELHGRGRHRREAHRRGGPHARALGAGRRRRIARRQVVAS